MSALTTTCAKTAIRRRAIRHLERVVRSSLPPAPATHSSPPTWCCAARVIEIGADLLLKATKVDGVYDKDPARVPPDANR